MKLFIDSSTDYLYLAVESNQSVKVQITKGKRDHSETLIDHLQVFFTNNDLCIEDINEIIVGRGPGSYTGLRIAGTVAKVFAYAKNLKFWSFSSLDLLLTTATYDGLYLGRIVAKKNHSYYKAIEIKDHQVKVICDDAFGEDILLTPYENYHYIEVTQEVMENIDVLKLINQNLLREEDYLNYVPNYLRSEL